MLTFLNKSAFTVTLSPGFAACNLAYSLTISSQSVLPRSLVNNSSLLNLLALPVTLAKFETCLSLGPETQISSEFKF
jgi:hypothetical protein